MCASWFVKRFGCILMILCPNVKCEAMSKHYQRKQEFQTFCQRQQYKLNRLPLKTANLSSFSLDSFVTTCFLRLRGCLLILVAFILLWSSGFRLYLNIEPLRANRATCNWSRRFVCHDNRIAFLLIWSPLRHFRRLILVKENNGSRFVLCTYPKAFLLLLNE